MRLKGLKSGLGGCGAYIGMGDVEGLAWALTTYCEGQERRNQAMVLVVVASLPCGLNVWHCGLNEGSKGA